MDENEFEQQKEEYFHKEETKLTVRTTLISSAVAIIAAIGAGFAYLGGVGNQIDNNTGNIRSLEAAVGRLGERISSAPDLTGVRREIDILRQEQKELDARPTSANLGREMELLQVHLSELQKEMASIRLAAGSASSGANDAKLGQFQRSFDQLVGRVRQLEEKIKDGSVTNAARLQTTAFPEETPVNLEEFSEGKQTNGCVEFPDIAFKVPFTMTEGVGWCESTGVKVQNAYNFHDDGEFTVSRNTSGYTSGRLNCARECEFIGPHKTKYKFTMKKIVKNNVGLPLVYKGILERN